MKRFGVLTLTLLVVVGLTATTALAASVKLKGGPNAKPSFTDNGLTLTASGELSGLGNAALKITVNARANPTATCTNPSGKQQPPGQNPAPVDVTGSITLTPDQIDKNGNAPFSVTTAPPVTPVVGAPDCPGSSWTEDITDMAFTSATIIVEQPPGTVVLTVSCTFSSPTSNGPVPGGNVSCTQTQS